MAITSSAKKALKASQKKRVFNLRRDKKMDNTLKEIKSLLAFKKTKEAIALVPKAYKDIDKAAKGYTIRIGNANRKKSRLMAMINKAIK